MPYNRQYGAAERTQRIPRAVQSDMNKEEFEQIIERKPIADFVQEYLFDGLPYCFGECPDVMVQRKMENRLVSLSDCQDRHP